MIPGWNVCLACTGGRALYSALVECDGRPGMNMRLKLGVTLVLAALVTSCGPGTTGSANPDGSGSGPGESCIRTTDCASGLTCINLTCTAERPDSGNSDASRPGQVGDSCVRTIDCEMPLRCVSQRCAISEDGGYPPDASASSSGGGDGGYRGVGCEEPGPAPRGVGGCCQEAADCSSALCIAGACSAPCTSDNDCTVDAPTTPFVITAVFTCGAYPMSATGRACLPGSLQACVPGGCPAHEACVPIGSRDADGGVVVTLRCTSRRVGGVLAGGA